MPSKYKLSNAMSGITRRIDNINDWNTSDTTTKLLMDKFSELETARLEIDDRWDEFLGEDPSVWQTHLDPRPRPGSSATYHDKCAKRSPIPSRV